MHPDEAAITHRAAMHDGAVPDGNIAAYRYIQPRAGVQHGVVLHIAARPDGNAAGIRAQHRAIPDAGIFSERYAARQGGGVSDKRCVCSFRGMIGDGMNGHFCVSFMFRFDRSSPPCGDNLL